MPSSPSARRTRVAAASLTGALVAGGLLVAAPAAQAAVLDNPLVSAGVGLSVPAGSACTPSTTAQSTSQNLPFAADGVARTATSTNTVRYDNPGNTADTTTATGTASSTVVATQAGGQLASVTVTSSFSAGISAALGSAQGCGASAFSYGNSSFSFDLAAPALVRVTAEVTNGTASASVAQDGASPTDDIGALATAQGRHSVGSGVALLPAGPSRISFLQSSTRLNAPTAAAPAPGSVSGGATVTVTFLTPGASLGAKTLGDGAKYADLAATRSCATGTVPATWTAKAGKGKHRKVAKAVFFVNDVKVATVKKPKAKQVTTLGGLDPNRPADVTAVLKLAEHKGGGKKGSGKRAGKVQLSRSYEVCQ